MSTASVSTVIGVAWSSIDWAMAVSSATVSPLARSETMKPATCTGVASPLRMVSIAQLTSAASRS